MKLIYILEVNTDVRDLITCALNTTDFKALGFECFKNFYGELKKRTPDLIILDTKLPEVNGMIILNYLKNNELYKTIPIIIIAAKSMEMDKVNGLELGADDFITKPFGILELIARIKAVLRRSTDNDKYKDVIVSNGILLDYNKREVRYHNNEIILTYKEFELLRFLMINKGVVLSRDKILKKIWGYEYKGEKRSVDINIRTLRQKLDATGCPNLIKTVIVAGYKFDNQHEY